MLLFIKILFTPDKQYTYLNSLSGGEKKRLQLLIVLFTNPNFLILDEPTNDLDLPTLAVLENFLSDYQGCVLIVSHDRYFMDRLVDHLFIFEGEGEVRDFPGNYTQYRLWLKDNEKKDNKWQALEDFKSKGKSTEEAIKEEIKATAKRKPTFKEKREFEDLEKEIASLEAEKNKIEEQLSNPDEDFERLNLLSKRIGEITSELTQKELRWLELSELM